MDVFSVLTLIGGLAMFLFGMNIMGDGLVQVSGGKLDSVLERLTSNKLKALLLGTAVTAVIQSSSVTTVMVVGFVNSGIMKLTQAVGVIMGANIGTTVTSWLLSLTGISGSNFWVSMLKPSSFSPILAAVGVVMMMTARGNARRKAISYILLGFAVLMTGMTTMSGAVEPLADNERFISILTIFSNPLLGVLAGALLTAVIQSSSASVGILQALCITGAVPYSVAIPVIMGQNIGTCVTALISGIGAGKNAKRASMIHLYFNLIGTAVFMVVFYSINWFVGFSFLNQPATVVGVAVFHSLFNIGCSIVWFPFSNFLVRLATITIPDAKEATNPTQFAGDLAVLDDRFLEKPAFAVRVARHTAVKMAEFSSESVVAAAGLIQDYSKSGAEQVGALEQDVSRYQASLGDYLMKCSSQDLREDDSRQVSVMLQCILDFGRIADHAANIRSAMDDMHKRGVKMTDDGVNDLMVCAEAVQDILGQMLYAFQDGNLTEAENIRTFEPVINGLCMELRQRHIDRLRGGKCSMEAGMILEDVITNFEGIYAHCLNVSVCILRFDGGEERNVRPVPEGITETG